MSQIREEVSFTKGRIIVRGKLVTTRQRSKRADYVLYYKPNIPIAVLLRQRTTSYAVSAMACSRVWIMPETLDSPLRLLVQWRCLRFP